MKNKSKFRPQKKSFKLTSAFVVWIAVFVVAVVFTQALRNSVSFIFIIVVTALPFADLAYGFLARSAVTADLKCSAESVEKNSPVPITLTVKNKYIIPVPFTEAELILPDANALSSVDSVIAAPLPSKGEYVYDKNVSFLYKGEYSCGIKGLYVYSLFRFFRFKLDQSRCKSIIVLPQRVTVDDIPQRYVNETSAVSGAPVKGADSAEITEIKEYVPGDPIRNIHWKLSTKAQELMTKHFGSENGLCTCVISDSGRFFKPNPEKTNDINEYCDDAVCELCCFAASESLLKGRTTSLVYPDDRGQKITRKTFEEKPAFEEYLPAYASARLTTPVPPKKLMEYSIEGTDNDIIYVTSQLTGEKVAALSEAQSVNRAVTLLLFEPFSRLENAAEVKAKNDALINELAAANVGVRRISEKELS